MGLYRVLLSRQVRKKDLPGIPQRDRTRIVAAIGKLAEDPRPAQATRLTGREEYRLRQGDYRILYVIEDEVRKVGHRREVYRG